VASCQCSSCGLLACWGSISLSWLGVFPFASL